MRKCLKFLVGDRGGATAVEYGLILAVIVLVMLSALITVANQTTGMWNNVHNKIEATR